jgi:hypothetical protein
MIRRRKTRRRARTTASTEAMGTESVGETDKISQLSQ